MMKRITLVISIIVLISVFAFPFKVVKAQCTKAVNVSDSLELVKMLGNRNGPVNEWWGVGLKDTLNECRVDSLFISHNESQYIKNGEFDLPFLRAIYLTDMGLPRYDFINAEILPSLESLSFANIGVGNNTDMPDFDIPTLKVLDMFSFGAIFSEIPDFSQMPELRLLKIHGFELEGEIPDFSNLEKLVELNIHSNTLGGNIPNFSNLPNLERLVFNEFFSYYSNLSGKIPNFDWLPNLRELIIGKNNLSGEIPNFDKLPKLTKLIVNLNNLEGNVPNFDKIPLLEELNLSENQLTGVIPNFNNLPLLKELYVCGGNNDFIGPLPTLENCPLISINPLRFSCVRPAPEPTGCSISESDSLELVNFYQATNGENWQINTGWLNEKMTSWWGIDFVDTLGKCRVNKILIRGIPDEVELPTLNLPFLEELTVDYNNFTGTIPDLSNLSNLRILNLGNNNFEGDLPDLNTFTQLEELNLSSNQLSGTLPVFSNNPLLRKINLSNNLITGTISDFQTIPVLNYLNISGNQLTDTIPNFSNLANLYTLNMADNELTGELPNFSNLPTLQSLFVQGNQLYGRVPNFSNLPLLEELTVCENYFEGTPPNFSFSTLLNVDAIDFSCLQSAKVSGYVYYDANENCVFDDGDVTLPNGLISINSGTNYQPIDENGFYEIALEVGTNLITFIQTSPLWQASCEDTYSITSLTINDADELNFANQPNIDCTQLTVDIGTPFLRRCFKNTYTVEYCNQGTQPAVDAYVEIDFEDEIIPLGASIPYEENNNLLTFQLAEVGIGECGSFTVIDSVACNAPLSSTGCVEANIYPNDYCYLPANWDGANLLVNAFCLNNDSVQFIIENIGEDMSTPSSYRIYEEDLITVQEEFVLNAGASKTLNYEANGSTYRVAVAQTPGHPSQNDAQAFFEFCGEGNFSTGYINSQLLPDRDPFVDIDCEEIIGSYDPNDKLVTPAGVGDRNDIYIDDELTYKIRFQNTGNDTAFTVVLVDTLDIQHLDVSTLEVLNSSHPYTLSIEDAEILTFTFNDILLVDSTANEQASHGFVTFKIKQNQSNQIGDIIMNQAHIYFDYNEAIVTPRVFSTLAEPRMAANFQYIPLTVGIENGLTNHLFAKVYPNPASEVFYVELPNEVLHQYTNLQLAVFNIEGQALLAHSLNKKQEAIAVTDLNSGIYYYRILSNDIAIANGKLLIE